MQICSQYHYNTEVVAVVAEYDREFNDGNIHELERDIDKYTEMLLEIPKAARKNIYAKIETADMQKTDLEIDLSKLICLKQRATCSAMTMAILTQKIRIRTPRMEFVF